MPSTPDTASCPRTRSWPRRAHASGMTFVGPSAAVLELAGNKARAVAAARDRSAGAGVLGAVGTRGRAGPAAESMDLPGLRQGGGRWGEAGACGGSTTRSRCPNRSRQPCARRASAFGDPTVFLEQAVINPAHIEVQILADTHGNVVHLVRAGLLPAAPPPEGDRAGPGTEPGPDTEDRDLRRRGGVREAIGYSCAGTVEFLVDERGQHVFIEMNSRIQVEHTVTEEITDVDLVQSRSCGSQRGSRSRIWACDRTSIRVHGAQRCSAASPPRIRATTSAPIPAASPPTARPAVPGVRLDGGTVLGAEIGAYFDSMLVKLTCRGQDLPRGGRPGPPRGHRVPHPRRRHQHPVPAGRARRSGLPRRGRVTTSFIAEHPAPAGPRPAPPTAAPRS